MRGARVPSLRQLPRAVRIEGVHAGRLLFAAISQVFFIDTPARAHHKRHYAAAAILGWIGNDGEAAAHLAVLHIVFRAASGMRPLRFYDSIIVAMKWRGFPGGGGCAISLAGSLCHECAGGTLRLARLRVPIQAVFLARFTSKVLRVQSRWVAVVGCPRVTF